MRQQSLHSARVGTEQDRILGRQHDHKCDRPALSTRDERLAALPDRQPFDLVGHQVVQELGTVGTADGEPASVRAVEQARVLGDPVEICLRQAS